MKHSPFVHLHLHTHYSLLDGAIRPEALFQKASQYKMPALAITDHGNMFGAIEFYQQACRHGIKPIIGCEMYIAPGSRYEKDARSGAETFYHLILLAQNQTGYKNLVYLVSKGYLEGFYYRPRIDKELLAERNEGLIALSACLHGELATHILNNSYQKALQAASEYSAIFDDRRFYLEIHENKIPEQKLVNERLMQMSRELSLPLVASNDCHYLEKREARAHDILLCLQTGKTLDSPDRMQFTTDEFYFKSPEEMIGLFSYAPEAISNTIEIAERCNLEFTFDETRFPAFQAPPGISLNDHLRALACKGLEERLRGFRAGSDYDAMASRYQARLDEELAIIRNTGFTDYFLIVADFMGYAKGRGIPVGPGRGSAAGSLVAYALNITDVDPITYGLLFERFLNPERISLPDIDIDFCKERRDEVIEYVTSKYSKDNVAQIITFGKMQAKGVVRDVGRVLGMPYKEVDRIAKLIPNVLNITLTDALKQEPRLRELMEGSAEVKDLFTLSLSLEGLPRHASTHAAGIVIADKPLIEYLPLYRGQNNEVVTQYDMKDVGKIGLIKFDFLGLKTLTVIEKCLLLIKRGPGRAARPPKPSRLTMRLPTPCFRCGEHRRGVPAGEPGHEGSGGQAQAGEHRGHHRPGGALPPRPAGQRHGGRFHQAQARQTADYLRAARAQGRSSPRPTASYSTRNRSCRSPASWPIFRSATPICCGGPWARKRREEMETQKEKFLGGEEEQAQPQKGGDRSSTRWQNSPSTGSTSRTARPTPSSPIRRRT